MRLVADTVRVPAKDAECTMRRITTDPLDHGQPASTRGMCMLPAMSEARSVDWRARAEQLDRHPDYRVLRRLEPLEPRHRFLGSAGSLHGCALDVETDGLDHRRHRIIELAMQRFLVDREGRIVEVGRPWRWVEDPGRPLPPEIVRLTGLTDAEVARRSICEAEASSIMMDVDFVVAHNASFDRPFCEARLPAAAGRPWICTMAEVDWRAQGYEGRSLPNLLMQAGWFYQAHSAATDVAALIRLLDHRMPSGATVLQTALATARRPTWFVAAVNAPFEAKDVLRTRSYRWNAERRSWCREVDGDALDEERAWLAATVYRGRGLPDCRRLDWTVRHAAS